MLAPFKIWPPHFGASERAYNIIAQLAQDGGFQLFALYTDYAQVAVATHEQESWPSATVIGVGPSKRWAQALNPFLILKGISLILRERPDVILCDHLWSALNALILHFLTGVPFILDDHNAEYVRLERMGKKAAGLVRILEKITCRFAARVICVSETDKAHLTQLGIEAGKISVVYNGVDIAQYRPNPTARPKVCRELGLVDEHPLVLFFGKLDYQPNAEAVEIIVQEIMPRVLTRIPQARFVICGYNPPLDRYDHPHLIFTGVVPKIQDYINASDLVIVPLISGGGTKFKIVQAVACGRPVVTTCIGSEGIEEAGEWMQVADDWDQFAEMTVKILTHRPSFSQEHLENFRQAYSWQVVAKQVARLLKAQV
jgi:glycosyltransferase involved in cell wall biosynthesis